MKANSYIYPIMFIASASAMLGGCKPDRLVDPLELCDSLNKTGWFCLELPEAKYGPGTVISVSDANSVAYLGHLEDCRIPFAEIVGVSDAASISEYKSKASRSGELSVKLAAQSIGATLGPEASSIARSQVTVQAFTTDSMSMIKLQIFLDNNNVPRACDEWFDRDDTYIVNDALKIGAGSVEFFDKDEIKLSATYPGIEDILDAEGSGELAWTDEGEVSISNPVVYAIKRVQRVEGSWQTMLSDPKYADERLIGMQRDETQQ